MKPVNKYAETATYSETQTAKLPAGAYEVRIIRAEEQGNALCILFDIASGEYEGYYMARFAEDKRSFPDTAKFKGVYRLWYEDDRKDEKSNERSRRTMKTALERIKQSNKLKVDFSKEWDGAALKDCRVGMIFRDEEYDYNGYQGFTARPYGVITLESLKEGRFTLPQPKRLKGSAGAAAAPTTSPDLLDDDLPF